MCAAIFPLESLQEFGALECDHSLVKKMEMLFARIDAEAFQKQLEADNAAE